MARVMAFFLTALRRVTVLRLAVALRFSFLLSALTDFFLVAVVCRADFATTRFFLVTDFLPAFLVAFLRTFFAIKASLAARLPTRAYAWVICCARCRCVMR